MANNFSNKHAVIIGATSGIGEQVARLLHADGWTIGIAGRRAELLDNLKNELGDRVFIKQIDICKYGADDKLTELINEVGNVDLVFHASGVGKQNPTLEKDIEMRTMDTNVMGFTRIVTAAYRYFAANGGGHIACISSVAGTKGMGAAPSYSATKRFQNTYIQCLCQHASINNTGVTFTDIKPGFVRTPLLSSEKKYPLMMEAPYVARKIVKAVYQKKRSVIINWKYRILIALWKIVPDWAWERMRIIN